MRRIYTRTGDSGTTAINGKIRVSKTDIRIEANGTLDELNVAIGLIRSHSSSDHPCQDMLKQIQMHIMSAMSLVATPSDLRHTNPNSLPDTLPIEIESFIDSLAAECTPADSFILPGGSVRSSFIHLARVTARRAERRLWALNQQDPVPTTILTFVNRLSDLFFIMARHDMQTSNVDEERWKSFAYKRIPK